MNEDMSHLQSVRISNESDENEAKKFTSEIPIISITDQPT